MSRFNRFRRARHVLQRRERARPCALALLITAFPALSTASAYTQGLPGTSAALTLKPTYGGALLVGKVTIPKDDSLLGVWSSLGRARLMKCAPRCAVMKTMPFQGTMMFTSDSTYRIVLGGNFKVGQKISLVFRFQNAQILNTFANVTK